MYSGTLLTKSPAHPGFRVTLYGAAPPPEAFEGVEIVHAPPGVDEASHAAWIESLSDTYVAFSAKTPFGEALVFAKVLLPTRWLIELYAGGGSQRDAVLTRALDSFQLAHPELEVDVVLPIVGSPLLDFLRAGFDVVGRDGDEHLRLRRPAGLSALELAARWRA